MSTEAVSPFVGPYYDASMRSLATLEVGVEYTLVRNNDNSDHGKVEAFFTSSEDAEQYITRLQAMFDAGPMGDHFHPGPTTLDIQKFVVKRLA